VRSVVLTLGAAGAVVADAAGVEAVPAVPAEVVDTTGAGDAYVGACAAALARGASLADAAAEGARLAAEVVARHGAQLTRQELAPR
jgi:ribokinase